MTADGVVPLYGIVLAGGAARRLSGVDKPMLEVGGIPLLCRSLEALSDAAQVVVVGPERTGVRGVRWVLEDPPGSGPVAALAAGLAEVRRWSPLAASDVAVLAGDLSGVTVAVVRRLRRALHAADGAEGAVLVDAGGRRQWLLGVWRGGALEAALPADPRGASMRGMLRRLSIVDVTGADSELADVDTEEDLRRTRQSGTLHSGHTGDRAQ